MKFNITPLDAEETKAPVQPDFKNDGEWDDWAKKNKTIGPDYDYSKAGTPDARGHSSDYGKLPNHPTFSNQSAYADADAGEWVGNGDDAVFHPSAAQLKNIGAENYRSYSGWSGDNINLPDEQGELSMDTNDTAKHSPELTGIQGQPNKFNITPLDEAPATNNEPLPAPVGKKADVIPKAREEGKTDYAMWHTAVAPAIAQAEADYIEEFSDQADATQVAKDARAFGRQKAMHDFNLTEEFMDEAPQVKPITHKQNSRLLSDYSKAFKSGQFNQKALNDHLVGLGHSQQHIDQLTLKTDTGNKSFAATVRTSIDEAGDGPLDAYAGMFQGIGEYISANYFEATAGYAPVEREMGEELLAQSVASKMTATLPALVKTVNPDSKWGADALEWNMNTQDMLKDTKGNWSKAAAEGPTLALEMLAPANWLKKAESAKDAIKMSAKVSSTGAIPAAGSIARDMTSDPEQPRAQDGSGLGEIDRAEVALWTTAIVSLPVVIASGAGLTKMVKPFIPGEQSRLAWKYVQRTLTPEQMARLDAMVADIRRTGAFEDLNDFEVRLIAASKLNNNLATDMAGEVANSANAQQQIIRMAQAVSGATGRARPTSQQAARFFNELTDQLKATAKGTNTALTNNLYSTGMPASDLTKSPNFDDIAGQLFSLPNKVQIALDRVVAADRADQVTYKMLDELQDGLFKYGTDTNNVQARVLAGDVGKMKDEVAQTTMTLDSANQLVKEAKDADMRQKILEGMFQNNAFGRMFKAAGTREAENLDPILTEGLDVGAMGKELQDFLNVLDHTQRKVAEELIVDTFAQGFETASAAARTFKIADFGADGGGKEIANSLNVFRHTNFTSVKAQTKLEALELISRVSEFDSKVYTSILNSPKGDIALEQAQTQSLGFGMKFKLAVQPFMRFFASRFVEGTAYRTRMKALLDKSKYTSKILGDNAVDFEALTNMNNELFAIMYEAMQPSAYNKMIGQTSGIKYSVKPPKQLKKFMEEWKEHNQYRDALVNTNFFKAVDGKQIEAGDFNIMAEAVKQGKIVFTAGDVIPVGNTDQFAVLLGGKAQFRNLGALSTGDLVPIRRILPRNENTELYAAFPQLSKLNIRGTKGGNPAMGGSVGQMPDGKHAVEVNTDVAADTLATMSGQKLNSLLTNALHEIGHFLAKQQGLPGGAKPTYWSAKPPAQPVGGGRVMAPKGPVTAKMAQEQAESVVRQGDQTYINDPGERIGQIAGQQDKIIHGPDGVPYHKLTYPTGSELIRPPHLRTSPGKSTKAVEPVAIDTQAVDEIEQATTRMKDSGYMSTDENKIITDLVPKVYGPPSVAPQISDATWKGDREALDIIGDYSSAFTDEDSLRHFHEISQAQRAGKKTDLDTQLFDKHEPNYQGVSYSGTRVKDSQIAMFEGLKPGDILGNKAFIATSTSPKKPADRFMDQPWLADSSIRKPMFVEIEGKGYDIGSSSSIKGEEEVLYAPGRSFEVLDSRTVGDVRILKLKEVDASAAKGKKKNMDMLGLTGASTIVGANAVTKSKEQ